MRRVVFGVILAASLLVPSLLSLSKQLEVERRLTASLVQQLQLATCRDAVKESRALYNAQLALHRNSQGEHQNVIGHAAR